MFSAPLLEADWSLTRLVNILKTTLLFLQVSGSQTAVCYLDTKNFANITKFCFGMALNGIT